MQLIRVLCNDFVEFSPRQSSIPFPASPFQQTFPQNARQTTPPAQSASTHTSQHVDQNQSEAQKVVIKLTPDGKPDPKYILSQLFRMMQEDSAAAEARKAKTAEADCKFFFICFFGQFTGERTVR
jgi:hypothetical protein